MFAADSATSGWAGSRSAKGMIGSLVQGTYPPITMLPPIEGRGGVVSVVGVVPHAVRVIPDSITSPANPSLRFDVLFEGCILALRFAELFPRSPLCFVRVTTAEESPNNGPEAGKGQRQPVHDLGTSDAVGPKFWAISRPLAIVTGLGGVALAPA